MQGNHHCSSHVDEGSHSPLFIVLLCQVIVTHGAYTALAHAIRAFLEPGDEASGHMCIIYTLRLLGVMVSCTIIWFYFVLYLISYAAVRTKIKRTNIFQQRNFHTCFVYDIWGAYEIKTVRNNNVRNIFNAKYNQITVWDQYCIAGNFHNYIILGIF